ETSWAIDAMKQRLLKRRARLFERQPRAGELDAIVAALRRLQNAHLLAYRRDDGLLLSEPFGARKPVCPVANLKDARRAVAVMFGAGAPAGLVRVLARFGATALGAAAEAGVRIAVVPDGRKFADYSAAVAALVPGLDDWSSPPSGLFVVEERRILLRSRALGMTAAHEFAHALDSVLASRPRSYFSYESDELRHYFATATGFVNEYAASGLDEYFAESMRAYLEINDSRCAWLPLTRSELHVRDPRMDALLDRLFATGLALRERRVRVR
ncbi:MAG TPA: hypothetical protein VEJ20_05890, partial [Candidatus Eremiobacteraceae bacterium]|nr:hypothetical protein [Candidatus Eremiobacteraceae bacterium]